MPDLARHIEALSRPESCPEPTPQVKASQIQTSSVFQRATQVAREAGDDFYMILDCLLSLELVQGWLTWRLKPACVSGGRWEFYLEQQARLNR
jgi:hypothetical protein